MTNEKQGSFSPPVLSSSPLTSTESFLAEKLLLLLIKRFVSESSSKEDSLSSRCSKTQRSAKQGTDQLLQRQGRGHNHLQKFPAEASPFQVVISTVLWDLEVQIKDSQQAYLEELVDH